MSKSQLNVLKKVKFFISIYFRFVLFYSFQFFAFFSLFLSSTKKKRNTTENREKFPIRK